MLYHRISMGNKILKTSYFFIAFSWILAIILVWQLLAGPFTEERLCQTGCFQKIYIASFVLALLAFLSIYVYFKRSEMPKFPLALWIASILPSIFSVTMYIGSFL